MDEIKNAIDAYEFLVDLLSDKLSEIQEHLKEVESGISEPHIDYNYYSEIENVLKARKQWPEKEVISLNAPKILDIIMEKLMTINEVDGDMGSDHHGGAINGHASGTIYMKDGRQIEINIQEV